jgi:hypothetical protein
VISAASRRSYSASRPLSSLSCISSRCSGMTAKKRISRSPSTSWSNPIRMDQRWREQRSAQACVAGIRLGRITVWDRVTTPQPGAELMREPREILKQLVRPTRLPRVELRTVGSGPRRRQDHHQFGVGVAVRCGHRPLAHPRGHQRVRGPSVRWLDDVHVDVDVRRYGFRCQTCRLADEAFDVLGHGLDERRITAGPRQRLGLLVTKDRCARSRSLLTHEAQRTSASRSATARASKRAASQV